MSSIRTQLQQGLRSELYEVFGNRPRLIKAFENLLFDVSTSIPDSLTGNANDIDDATARAQNAATVADANAQIALAISQGLADGPPPLPAPALPDADDWMALVMQLLARVGHLEQDLANLREGPTP